MPEPYEEESRPTEMLSRYNSVISKHCINIKNSEFRVRDNYYHIHESNNYCTKSILHGEKHNNYLANH